MAPFYLLALRYVCACSFVSNPLWPHGLQSARLLSPENFPGKNTTGLSCPTYSGGSSQQPRDLTQSLCVSCTSVCGFLTTSATWEALLQANGVLDYIIENISSFLQPANHPYLPASDFLCNCRNGMTMCFLFAKAGSQKKGGVQKLWIACKPSSQLLTGVPQD